TARSPERRPGRSSGCCSSSRAGRWDPAPCSTSVPPPAGACWWPCRSWPRPPRSGPPAPTIVLTVSAAHPEPARLVVLVSGSGTNLQALIDACEDPAYGARIVAVGADRDGIEGLHRAERHGIPTFVERVADHPDRAAWDVALAEDVAAHDPDLVVLAGFMKLTGPAFLARFGGRTVNTHPALSPAFPGMHGPRDALAY